MSELLTRSMVAIVVLLLTALLILTNLGKIKEIYAGAMEKQTCKTNVKAHSMLKLRYADFSGEINCPTVPLKIDDKNEEIAKKKLAGALYDCWDQFGEGKLELFSGDSVYCHICHRITFGEKIKINGLTTYLATHNAPNQKISYLQYLTAERTQNSEVLNEFEKKNIVDTIDASKNKEYAIVFTYIKGKKYLDEYLEKAKYTAPGIGLIALGFGVIKVGGALGGVVSATVIGLPAGILIAKGSLLTGGFMMAGGVAWSFLAGYFAGVPFEHIALISFIPYDAQSIQSLNCKELPIK